MSSSSLWVMDKDYNGSEVIEFRNSWLFSPIVWSVLSDKYIRGLIETPYGYKKNLISDSSLFSPLNNKVNNCENTSDRICWEMSNQQVFFTKDKHAIAENIRQFPTLNSNFDRNGDGSYPLRQEHIVKRFNDIADAILELDENETPFFVFKNTSVDDGVESWFSEYNESADKYKERSLGEIDGFVTEFVFITKGAIEGFKSNVEYFKKGAE